MSAAAVGPRLLAEADVSDDVTRPGDDVTAADAAAVDVTLGTSSAAPAS